MVSTCRVIGTGSIGSRYLRLLATRSKNPPRAVPAGGFFRGAELSWISIHEPYSAAERPAVDLTVIATRTSAHVRDFHTFGKLSHRVLIEKPIAPSYLLAQPILSSGMVSFSAVSAPLRFTQGFEVVTALLPQAGRIVEVESVCQSWLPDWRPNTNYRLSYSADPNEGGVLRDLVHEIDYTLKLFGPPESVSAVLEHSKELEIEAEASAVLTWQYPNFDLTMTLDYTSPVVRRYLSIRGELATLTWNVLEGTVKVHESHGVETQVFRFPKDLSKDGLLVRQLEALVSPGKHSQLCTIQDAIRAVALCDAARESDKGLVPTILSGPPWEGE